MKKTDIKEGVTYRNKDGSIARRVTKMDPYDGRGGWGVGVEYEVVRGKGTGGQCFLTSFAAWAHGVDGEPAPVDLRQRIAELEEALKPFAEWSRYRLDHELPAAIRDDDGTPVLGDESWDGEPVAPAVYVGDLKRAAKLLEKTP